MSHIAVENKLRFTHVNEWLYGRAGALFALISCPSSPPPESEIISLLDCMAESGRKYSRESKSISPLMYQWHHSEYLGAAHGLGCILYAFLLAHKYLSSEFIHSDLIPSLDALMTFELPPQTGHFPMCANVTDAPLCVHWCHGAPGMVFVFASAYETLGDIKYRDIALRCGEVVWKEGLLIKGPGLCHGVSGNGFGKRTLSFV